MDKIKKIISQLPFSNGAIIDAINIYNVLKSKGVNFEDLSDFMVKNKIKRIKTVRCPLCNSNLLFFNIRAEKGRKNKFGYKKNIICSNDICLFEKFEN